MKTILSLLLTLSFASSIAAQEVKVKCYSAPAPALISDTMSAKIIPMLPKGFRYEKLEMTVEGKPVAIHQGAGHFQYSIESDSPWISYIDTSSQDIVDIKLAGELTVWKSRKRKTRQSFQIAFPVIKPKISVTADFDSLVAFWRCGNHLTLQAQGVKDFTRYFQQMTADSCHIEVLDSVKGMFILEPRTKGINIKQIFLEVTYQQDSIAGYNIVNTTSFDALDLCFDYPAKRTCIPIPVRDFPAPFVDGHWYHIKCMIGGNSRDSWSVDFKATPNKVSKYWLPRDAMYRCTILKLVHDENQKLWFKPHSGSFRFSQKKRESITATRVEVDIDVQRRNYKGEVFTIGSRSFNYSIPRGNR